MRTTTPSILLVNPNTNTATTDLLVTVAEKALAGSGFDVVGVTAAAGPSMIVDAEALYEAAEHTVTATLTALEEQRHCAVIIGAFGDPGATELRSLVEIPVVGIGRAAVYRAARGGRRFAIATTTGALTDALLDLVDRSEPAANMAGIFLTGSDPLVLAKDAESTVVELGKAVDDAVAAGAEAVIIGGGPLSDSARELARRTDVVIIEPVPSAVAMVLDELKAALPV